MVAFFTASYFGVDYLTSQTSDFDPDKKRIEIGSFEDTLLNGTSVQLINTYNQLEQSTMLARGTEMPLVIDAYKKRLQISNRMLEIAESDESRRNGLAKKMRVLSQWDYTNVTKDFDDPETRALLFQTAEQAVAEDDDRLKKLGQLAKTIAGIYDFANAPEGKSFEPLVTAFSNTAESLTDDIELSQVMIRTCKLLAHKNQEDEAGQLLSILSTTLAKSKDDNIRRLASEAKIAWLAQTYGLPEIPTLLDIDQSVAVKKIHTIMEEFATNPDSGHGEAEVSFRMLLLMTQRNLIDDVKQDLPRLGQMIAKLESETDTTNVAAKYNVLAGQVAAFNKPLDLSGLQDTAGQRFPVEAFAESAKILYFWSPESQNSIDGLLGLHRQSDFFRRKSIVALTVFIDKTNSENDMRIFKDQAADLEKLKLYRADQKDEKGKLLLEQFPVESLPTLIVLDEENRVRAINPVRGRLKAVTETVLREIAERDVD